MIAGSVVAQIVVLGCKASLAVLLLAAGGAKLADLQGFASTVRLFVPKGQAWIPAVAAPLVAAGELAAGAASLSMPRAAWISLVVMAIFAGFLVTWIAGYARHRGRLCQCFGGLSRSGFSRAGIARAAGLVLGAVIASLPVPRAAVALGLAGQLGLVAAGALVAGAAFSAAAATGRRHERAGWA